MDDICRVVLDKFVESRLLTAEILCPEHGSVEAGYISDRSIPVQAERFLDLFQPSGKTQPAAHPSQINVNWGKGDARKRRTEKAQIKAGAIKRNHNRVLLQGFFEFIKVLALDIHVVASPVVEANQGHRIEYGGQASRLNVQINAFVGKLRKDAPRFT